MKNKDERTRVTTEILNNIKSIKLYSWTSAFAAKLAHIRNDKELKTLRKIGGAQAASRFCWNTTPFLVSCATFTLYVLVNKAPLSVDLVFPALTLFNLLTMPLTQFPNVITSVVESTVAANRLKSFLTAGEIQNDAVEYLPAATEDGEETVKVWEASFTWGFNDSKQVLSDISFSARKGELNCIVGRVGSGKSSLLQAILGDLHKVHGEVSVRGTIAYVAQNAWIMNASVSSQSVCRQSAKQTNIYPGQRQRLVRTPLRCQILRPNSQSLCLDRGLGHSARWRPNRSRRERNFPQRWSESPSPACPSRLRKGRCIHL